MRPDLKDADRDTGPPRNYRLDTAVQAEKPGPGVPPSAPPLHSPHSASESRLNERIGRLLRQKKGPDTLMLVVLSVAILLGLIGFALHFLWIVAIVVMALGLGFVVADSRRDRIDIANETTDGAPQRRRDPLPWPEAPQ
jgi:hypothetical protein